ncbi:MAG: GyrI-like domain-containing protein [Bacteroidota bacterium]
MNQSTRIESFGPVDLMGVVLYGNPSKVRFHDAWVHFGKVADELALSRIDKNLYGLQVYPPTFPAVFEFTYMASIETNPGITVPIRMLTKTVPRCTYAVQKVIGGVDGIDEALQYLYREYIPAKGLKVAMPFDFEKYCNVRSQDHLQGDIEVWVPVEQ